MQREHTYFTSIHHACPVVAGVLWRAASFRPTHHRSTTKMTRMPPHRTYIRSLAVRSFLNLPACWYRCVVCMDLFVHRHTQSAVSMSASQAQRQRKPPPTKHKPKTTRKKTQAKSAKLLCDKFFEVHPPRTHTQAAAAAAAARVSASTPLPLLVQPTSTSSQLHRAHTLVDGERASGLAHETLETSKRAGPGPNQDRFPLGSKTEKTSYVRMYVRSSSTAYTERSDIVDPCTSVSINKTKKSKKASLLLFYLFFDSQRTNRRTSKQYTVSREGGGRQGRLAGSFPFATIPLECSRRRMTQHDAAHLSVYLPVSPQVVALLATSNHPVVHAIK